jgi:hypothetical protein
MNTNSSVKWGRPSQRSWASLNSSLAALLAKFPDDPNAADDVHTSDYDESDAEVEAESSDDDIDDNGEAVHW